MADLSHIRRVLIVEDDFLIATDLEGILEELGCREVDMTGSCATAVDLVRSDLFELALVDVKLSDTDCHQLVELLRLRSIPFLYLSGYQQSDYPGLPNAPWLTKPAENFDILAAITSVLPEHA
ncbi:MAG TPA: response regulator [Devosia sp.]|nr:response regulator [Devosia sp.]